MLWEFTLSGTAWFMERYTSHRDAHKTWKEKWSWGVVVLVSVLVSGCVSERVSECVSERR